MQDATAVSTNGRWMYAGVSAVLALGLIAADYYRPPAYLKTASRANKPSSSAIPLSTPPATPSYQIVPEVAVEPPEVSRTTAAAVPSSSAEVAPEATPSPNAPHEDDIELASMRSQRRLTAMSAPPAIDFESPTTMPTESAQAHAVAVRELPVETVIVSSTLHPATMAAGGSTCSTCTTCGGEGICDGVCRSKGCDRERCPCPSDEILTYYRCEHYGHYPTFWRPWPQGWLRYRPSMAENYYDRYRKPRQGEISPDTLDVEPRLDPRELQRPLPGVRPRPSREPDLLPEPDLPRAEPKNTTSKSAAPAESAPKAAPKSAAPKNAVPKGALPPPELQGWKVRPKDESLFERLARKFSDRGNKEPYLVPRTSPTPTVRPSRTALSPLGN